MATPDWAGLIGFKSRAQLMDAAEARWRALGGSITNFNVGGVFRTVIELTVEMVSAVHDLALSIVPKGFLQWADGDWLPTKAAEVGVVPHAARKARWALDVGRVGTSGNVVIPAHSRYRTRTTAQGEVLVYDQVDQVILPDGQSVALVLVEALEAGARYNVAPGAICEFVTAVPGVSTVSNPADGLVTEGTDDESPESVRTRAQLRWPSLSRGAVREAYESWTREVVGVADVAVLDQHPRGDGTVDVIVTGTAGAPSDELIAAVDAYLRLRVPQCVDLLVRGPVLVPVTVVVRVSIPTDRGDTAATSAVVLQSIESLMATGAVVDVPRLAVGKSLWCSRLLALAMDGPDVFEGEVIEPAANVQVDAGELVVLDVPVTVQVGRAQP